MLWDINEIQFARLLEEIRQTQTLHLSQLADSMNLELHEVDELFARARNAWDKSKVSVQAWRRLEKQCQALVELNEKLNDKCDSMMVDVQALSDHNRELIEKNERLTKELKAEFERYAKLDDVRYELEVKLKAVEQESDGYVRELGKLRKLIASYKEEQGDLLEQVTKLRDHNEQLVANIERLEEEMCNDPDSDPEPYLGPAPWCIQSPGKDTFQSFIHSPESAYEDYARAVRVGVENPRIINHHGEDVTDAFCKKFEDDGAE